MNEKDFIQNKVEEIKSGLKIFPSDFLNENISVKEFSLPGKILIMGEELFGKYEIVTKEGDSVFQADNYNAAKYLVYSGRTKPLKIQLPVDDTATEKIVRSYEKYLDELVRTIQNDYRKNFPESKNMNAAVNEIFLRANLIRY